MQEIRTNESETAFYTLWRVEEFPFMERTKSEAGLKINGIRKIHQLTLNIEGIRDKKLSCMSCEVSALCQSCQKQKVKFNAEKIKNVLDFAGGAKESEESDEETPIHDLENTEDGDDHFDIEALSNNEEECEKDLDVGDVVWVWFNRRWVASKIVTLSDIPSSSLSRQLKSNSGSTSLVKGGIQSRNNWVEGQFFL